MNNNLKYWEQRYSNMSGEKTVGNSIWTEKQYKEQLNKWIDKIQPFINEIEPFLHLLDFGVGIGRWFPYLLRHGCVDNYYGCDIIDKIPDHIKSIMFGLIEDNKIPFKSAKFDLIWTCVVLQHVVDEELLKYYAKQFHDRIYKFGHLLITENISEHEDLSYLTFRTETYYIDLFEGVGFSTIKKDYIVDGHVKHVVLLFRKEK